MSSDKANVLSVPTQDRGDDGNHRSFAVGEKIRVHDGRAPHGLRPATVVRLDPSGLPETTYILETGLGGKVQAGASQMHHLDDQVPVSGCSHCGGS